MLWKLIVVINLLLYTALLSLVSKANTRTESPMLTLRGLFLHFSNFSACLQRSRNFDGSGDLGTSFGLLSLHFETVLV
jgi:hypothetical protein